MVRRTWLLYLWPGVVPLILEPGWGTFLIAAGYAALFHLCLTATLLWPEIWPPLMLRGAWLLLAGAWAGSIYWERICERRQRSGSPSPAEDLFPKAQEAYLRGEWSHAESLLGRLLRRNPRDDDALLLLISLWRRTGRLDAAEQLLREFERLDAARRWYPEIQREKQLLAEKRAKIIGTGQGSAVPPAEQTQSAPAESETVASQVDMDEIGPDSHRVEQVRVHRAAA